MAATYLPPRLRADLCAIAHSGVKVFLTEPNPNVNCHNDGFTYFSRNDRNGTEQQHPRRSSLTVENAHGRS